MESSRRLTDWLGLRIVLAVNNDLRGIARYKLVQMVLVDLIIQAECMIMSLCLRPMSKIDLKLYRNTIVFKVII